VCFKSIKYGPCKFLLSSSPLWQLRGNVGNLPVWSAGGWGLSVDAPCIPMHAPNMPFYMVRFDSLLGSMELELRLEATPMRNEDRLCSIESLPRPCGKQKGPSLHRLAKSLPRLPRLPRLPKLSRHRMRTLHVRMLLISHLPR
jgi:hypothetical protein